MSKTYQYRKVMKPMLERKRRARINKCLDELKDLMVATLESEGEHVTRLEKAGNQCHQMSANVAGAVFPFSVC